MPAAWPPVKWTSSPPAQNLPGLPVPLTQVQAKVLPGATQAPQLALCWLSQPHLESHPNLLNLFPFLGYTLSSAPPGLCSCCSPCFRYLSLLPPSPSSFLPYTFLLSSWLLSPCLCQVLPLFHHGLCWPGALEARGFALLCSVPGT